MSELHYIRHTPISKGRPMSDFKAPPVSLYQPGLVWFNQADTSGQPCPAIPIEQTANGVLTLLVMRKNNTGVSTKMGVRHVDDPFLKTCMDARLECGGWMEGQGLKDQREQIQQLKDQIEELLTAPKRKKEPALT